MKAKIGKFGLINNFLPYFRLEQEGIPLIEAPPARLAAMFEEGEMDFAPVPSFYYIKNKGRLKKYDFCVASKNKVLSVLLVSKNETLDDGSIAITNQTVTSLNLLKIILNERKMKNSLVSVNEGGANRLLRHCPHALVIGDEAIKARAKWNVIMDLGEEWRRLTGCSMVFGISVSRKDADMSEANKKVMASVRWGQENVRTIVAEAEKKFQLGKGFLEMYFESLVYGMGTEEIKGLELFEEKCRKWGLL